MKEERIEAPEDPRLDPFRGIGAGAQPDGALFVAESRHVVRRLLEGGRFRVRALLATPRAREALAPQLERLPADARLLVAEKAVLSQVAGYRVHQGCLALAERGAVREPLALADAAARGAGRLLVLEGVADPQNVGGVFRNARAFGVDAVWLAAGGADPLARKAVRVSTGSTLEVPFARCTDWPAALARLRTVGFAVWALCADEGEPLETAADAPARAGRVALLLGGEEAGLTGAARRAADRRVRIATAPGFDSLNVATACVLALHRLAPERPVAPCAS